MDSVIVTIAFAIAFGVLLGVEGRYRLGSIRFAAATLALILLFFARPNYTGAARWALSLPPAERVTHIGGARLSEYVSGVRTMEQKVGDIANGGAYTRLLSLAVLFWLACSPALRHERSARDDPRNHD